MNEFEKTPQRRLRTDIFIDATHMISVGGSYFRKMVDDSEREAKSGEASPFSSLRSHVESHLTTEFFSGDAPGKVPRRVDIKGKAFREDSILSVDTPEYVELTKDSSLLHGIVLIDTRGDYDSHYDVAFHVEETESGVQYYFPFWKVEQLLYAEQSADVEYFLLELEELSKNIEKWKKSDIFEKGSPADRIAMLEGYQAKSERDLYDYIFDEDETHYEVDSDFFFVAPFEFLPVENDPDSQNRLNLELFNSTVGGLSNEPPRKIDGTFGGFTFPASLQPNLINEDGQPTTFIDPYEPCVVFESQEFRCDFVVPVSKLRSIV